LIKRYIAKKMSKYKIFLLIMNAACPSLVHLALKLSRNEEVHHKQAAFYQ